MYNFMYHSRKSAGASSYMNYMILFAVGSIPYSNFREMWKMFIRSPNPRIHLANSSSISRSSRRLLLSTTTTVSPTEQGLRPHVVW
ncbi:hypothetical protein TNCV_3333311 [Trichonephila clavipes]|nr:hypothetical protein TNCV_3333311 [Trichonephila clavipes]